MPRCGALNLLQKTPHYRGDPAEAAAGLNAKLLVLVVMVTRDELTPTGGSEFDAVPPRLAVLVAIVADRPGAWFPGPLGPYEAWFPAICLISEGKTTKKSILLCPLA